MKNEQMAWQQHFLNADIAEKSSKGIIAKSIRNIVVRKLVSKRERTVGRKKS